MAFHIPFNQRSSARRKPAPIYIGFETPRPPRKKFNWWGFNGMWMSFASLICTAGVASPIPLLISLNGLRKPGKKMASVGTVVSTLGIAVAATMFISVIASHNHRVHARQVAHYNRVVSKQIAETNALLAIAAIEIEEFRNDISDDERFDVEANMLILKHVDPWGESLRFELSDPESHVRSAGPDKQFNTHDDVALAIQQDTQSTVQAEMTGETSAEQTDGDAG